jgi:hypothetical protein
MDIVLCYDPVSGSVELDNSIWSKDVHSSLLKQQDTMVM